MLYRFPLDNRYIRVTQKLALTLQQLPDDRTKAALHLDFREKYTFLTETQSEIFPKHLTWHAMLNRNNEKRQCDIPR